MADGVLRSRFVTANGVKTHYTECGDGPRVLVALHGGGAGSSGEAGMGLVMKELAADFRVIAPDSVGGYGETDPYVPTPFGIIDRLRHLEDVLDALCLERFAVMGNSQGAWTASKYAMLHPDRVTNCICVSSLTIANSMGISQAATPAMTALASYDGTRDGMRRLLEGLIVDKAKVTDELIDRRQAAATRPGALEASKAFFKNTGELRNNPLLADQLNMKTSFPILVKQIPTIFIWGDADTFAVPETGRKLQALLPDVPFHWVPGAGHQVQNDKPAETAAIIRKFLAS